MSKYPGKPEVIAAAEQLLSQTVPVLLLETLRKRPYVGHNKSWWVLTEPNQAKEVIEPLTFPPNIGMLLTPKGDSPLIAIDIDGDDAWGHLRSRGVASDGPCWVARTGRGGFHVIYHRPPGEDLPRVIRAHGKTVDLLVDGYTVCPPSDTSKAPGGGGTYRWAPGHSPDEISVAELAEPPAELVEWWKSAPAGNKPAPSHNGNGRGAPAYLRGPIPDGQRNDTLTKVGGHFRRLGLAQDVIEAHLLAHNSRCIPPLSDQDIKRIAKSVSRYEDNSIEGLKRRVMGW